MCAQTLDIELSHSLLPLISIRIFSGGLYIELSFGIHIKFNKLTSWPSDRENINIYKQLTKIIDVHVVTCICDKKKCHHDVDCSEVDF